MRTITLEEYGQYADQLLRTHFDLDISGYTRAEIQNLISTLEAALAAKID